FRRQLDQYTTSNNAYTEYYSTVYTNTLRPDLGAIQHVLGLEAQRMDQLVLQQKNVPSEIEIVRREREMRMDQPGVETSDKLMKAAYGNTSLGRLPIGDLNELTSIKMDELQQFYRTWYAPNNAVIVVTGKFDKAQVLQAIDQKFSAIAARSIPKTAPVAPLDMNKVTQRHFVEKKGSNLLKQTLYLDKASDEKSIALSFAPYLYSLQPNGVLYKKLVVSGQAIDAGLFVNLNPAYNMVNAVALYSPQHDAKKLEQALIQDVEQGQDFNSADVQRIKNMLKNGLTNTLNSSSSMANILTQYVVKKQGRWDAFFKEQQAAQNISVADINQAFKQTFIPKNRIVIDVLPTPEDQKKAMQAKAAAIAAEQKQGADQEAEPLKDVKSYQQDTESYLKSAAPQYQSIDAKIQRGALKNGMRYAFYPVATPDDQVYAKITLDFGNENLLKNKAEILEMTTYLLSRGSVKHSLQDIQDKTIEANGAFNIDDDLQGMTITVQADKAHFYNYFQFIVGLLKQPAFSQSEFDLAKSQNLAALDRPYTEPATVASLVLDRLTEHYPAGDIRFHSEPALEKKQWQQLSNAQVKQFYQQLFGFNHAQIAITGEFQPEQMQQFLQTSFTAWDSVQPYQRITSVYQPVQAKKVHALAERREFGYYLSEMELNVGDKDPDAPALYVLSEILGGSQLNSRLGKELREKRQLIYGFGSRISLGSYSSAGTLKIITQYTPGKADQVSKGVHTVLQDLITRGVTDVEVEAAKAEIMKKRSTLLGDSRKIQNMLNYQLERNETMLERAKRDQAYAQLTTADINAAIKKYIKPEYFVEVMADQYGQPQPEPKF
ncbi:MAG: insulinase family protein, partial [Acinetobacter sp.]